MVCKQPPALPARCLPSRAHWMLHRRALPGLQQPRQGTRALQDALRCVLPALGAPRPSLADPPTPLAHGTAPTCFAGGSLEYVFVLEDKTDPAYAVITTLIRELQGRRPVRIQSAGFAEHTSQKIHK